MRAFLNWSGGKDSAWCLHYARKHGIPIEALVTAVNEKHDRISMHGVRRTLLEQQAASVQLPLYTIGLPEMASMTAYEEQIHKSNLSLMKDGFDKAVFGDLYLEDLKRYREALYKKDGITCLFPLWKMDTRTMMKDFIAAGFKAIIVCVNGSMLDRSFCGRMLDEDLLNDLPPGVDPCGENGEYHSFVFDGPGFTSPVAFKKGEIICREYDSPKSDDCFKKPTAKTSFYFCELA